MLNRIRSTRQSRPRSRFAAIKPGFDRLENRVVLSTDTYTNLAGGSWYTTSNWSLGTVPTTADTAVIPSLNAGAVVTIPSGNTVTLPNGIISTGTATINLSGTISNTTVGIGLTVQGKGGTLDNVTLLGKGLVAGGTSPNYDTLNITNGLHLNNILTLGKTTVGGFLNVVGSQTIDTGTSGTILFAAASGFIDSNKINLPTAGSTLTLGSGITTTAAIGTHALIGGTGVSIVNNGVIKALGNPTNGAGANLYITGSVLNNGEYSYTDGAQGAITGSLLNNGSFTVDSNRIFVVSGAFIQTSTGTLLAELWKAPLNAGSAALLSTQSSTIAGNVVSYTTPSLTTSVIGNQYWLLKANAGQLTGSFAGADGGTLTKKPNASTGPNVYLTVTTPPASLTVESQPSDFVAYNTPFTVQVAARKADGSVDTSFNGQVTLAVNATNSPPSSTVLTSTNTTPIVNAVGGYATFANVHTNVTGTYTLKAIDNSPGMASLSKNLTPFSIGYTPTQMRAAYGLDSLTNFTGGVTPDGTGQTIAIIAAYHSPDIAADLAAFDTQFGLSAPPSFSVVNVLGHSVSTTPGSPDYVPTDPNGSGTTWNTEVALDVEWAHAIAPGAHIVLIETPSYAINDLMLGVGAADLFSNGNYSVAGVPPVSVVSMSWGASEGPTSGGGMVTSTDEDFYEQYFQFSGVTYVAASGDDGNPGVYPAYSPSVMAVGGTELTQDSGGVYSQTTWHGSGGGTTINTASTQPLYQSHAITSTYRTIPDVSMDASERTAAMIYDTHDAGGSVLDWRAASGTSLAAPMWAGIMAIVNQGRLVNQTGSVLTGYTQSLPALYSLASNFTDIATGDNGTDNAVAGYDIVTGLGTPTSALINALVNWQAVTVTGSTLPDGSVGTSYDETLSATGGTGSLTYNYNITAGSIAGLSFTLSSSGLEISGTPSAAGTVMFTLITVDSYGALGEQEFTLTVDEAGGGMLMLRPLSRSTTSQETAVPAIPAIVSLGDRPGMKVNAALGTTKKPVPVSVAIPQRRSVNQAISQEPAGEILNGFKHPTHSSAPFAWRHRLN